MYKFILGVNMKTANWVIRSELGRFPIHVEVLSSILSYFDHLFNVHSESELLINALRTSFHVNNNGNTSWFSLVGHLMRFVGLDQKNPKSPLLMDKDVAPKVFENAQKRPL